LNATLETLRENQKDPETPTNRLNQLLILLQGFMTMKNKIGLQNRRIHMLHYNLFIVSDDKTLSAVASNKEDALRMFGKEIGSKLSLAQQDVVPPYLMDEWTESPHWVNCTIPVFEISN
jgi:hypothetical protein